MKIVDMKINNRPRFLQGMGITLSGHSLTYGQGHGLVQGAPEWLKHTIVSIWNHVTCTLLGHDLVDIELYKQNITSASPRCVNCGRRLKVDGRYPTKDELKAHKVLVIQSWEQFYQITPEEEDEK